MYPAAAGLVALRKESVDRNATYCKIVSLVPRSLSARRAWIEIWGNYIVIKMSDVALRKESVDRNCPPGPPSFLFGVALRKESVDRNPRGQ